jgi:hypothetical protein
MAHMAIRNRVPKTATALKLRSHSIDKLNHYDRRTGAAETGFFRMCQSGSSVAVGVAAGGRWREVAVGGWRLAF